MTAAAPVGGYRHIPGTKGKPWSPPPSLAERIARAPTPSRIKGFRAGVWALTALLFLLGEGSLTGARRAMQTVGKDTAPSIIAAQEISSALADLDANAGNYLLGNNKAHQAAAQQTFEQRRVRATSNLVDAFLYKTNPVALPLLGGATLIVVVTAILAAVGPTRRAACVDPAVILRML